MKNLLNILDEIAKYGLHPNLVIEEKERELEQNLIRLYSKYFEIKYEYDESDYADINENLYPNVVKNVKSNFPDFGVYHSILNSEKATEAPENAMGHAVDDLSDIINDILEIKWRIENNSMADGLWFFELSFYSHTQKHLIDLLNFMKSKNG